MPKKTALSMAESEHCSVSSAVSDVLYLRKLLEQPGFAREALIPVSEDNMACIEWGNNIVGGRERAKHVDIWKQYAQVVI
jgi:hypothetical protein